MEIAWRILEIINWVMIGIGTISFLFQIVMIIFIFLKEKKFPNSEKKNRIAILIPARNEEKVIGKIVESYLNNQDYPKDKYEVFVVAHNCTDNTAEIAKNAGATVFPYSDPDPRTHKVSYALKHGIEKILEIGKEFDFMIRFDADNQANPDFLNKMNDAFNAGVEIARPFEASSNPTQNIWTSVSFNYYARDSRIASNFRENLHLDSMLTGAGMMVSFKVLKEIGGWDAMSQSEDAEFTVNRLLENKRVHYVSEAVVYEDQPSTMKDTYRRLARMGNGLHGIFWKKGWKLFGHFFKSCKWSNIDLFVQLLMVVFSVIAFAWFVPYYIFYAICHLSNGYWNPGWMANMSGIDGRMMTAAFSQGQFTNLLVMAAIVLGSFIVLYPLQAFLSVYLSKDKLKIESMKPCIPGILISPLFMVFYGVSILLGVLTRAGWKAVRRNPK